MSVFWATVLLFPILIHSVLLLIPSLCFCPCASSTCCGSVCWNVGGKSLGFAWACYELALKKGDFHCSSSTDRAVGERECVAKGVDGESGNALILCQEENNFEPCAGAHQGSLGWASDCEAWWTVLFFPALFSDWTVSIVLLLSHCWITSAQNLPHSWI